MEVNSRTDWRTSWEGRFCLSHPEGLAWRISALTRQYPEAGLSGQTGRGMGAVTLGIVILMRSPIRPWSYLWPNVFHFGVSVVLDWNC